MDNLIEIPIFRAGRHRSANGVEREYSVGDLAEMAVTYSPDRFKAPVIVSHDTKGIADKQLPYSELAYGFPDRLKVVGDKLVASFSRIVPQVVDWWRSGQLLGLSPSFYMPNNPHNPTPGRWHLRHIALLGKTPPAVKGIGAEFSEDELITSFAEDEQSISFSFDPQLLDFGCGCEDDDPLPQVLSGIRDFLIDKYDIETADRIVPFPSILKLSSRMETKEEENDDDDDDDFEPTPIYKENETGMNFKKMMKDLGMSVTDVADETGIDEETLTAYASGESTPTPAHKKKLMALMGGSSEESYSEGNIIRESVQLKNYSEVDIDAIRRQLQQLSSQVEEAQEIAAAAKAQTAEYREQAQNAALNAEIAKIEADRAREEMERMQQQSRRQDIESFCEQLERDGVLLPHQTGVRVVDFGEGDEQDVALVDFMESLDDGQLSYLKGLLEDLAPQVDYSESDRSDPGERGHDSSFPLPRNTVASEDSRERLVQVVQFCEERGWDADDPAAITKAARQLFG
jgi:transcriptional regulator with XRE-family HTH domain